MEDTGIVLVRDPKQMDAGSIRDGLTAAKCPAEPVWVDDLKSPTDFDPTDVRFVITTDHELGAWVKDVYVNLEMVSLGYTGIDAVDHSSLGNAGVSVYSSPDYATESVAELNLLLVLALLRRLPECDRNVRGETWDVGVTPGRELSRLTVGIIGTGAIGLQTARLFKSVGCSLIGYSRSVNPAFEADDLEGCYVSSVEQLAQRSDVVVLSVPLTTETRKIFSRGAVNAMRDGALLVNASRSELVDLHALKDGLASGKIGGSALDVYEDEPVRAGHFELGLPGVLLTPHIGYKTREALDRLAQIVTANFAYYASEEDEVRSINRITGSH